MVVQQRTGSERPSHYALNVTITANGELLFLNKTRIPIITYNNPTAQIEVRVDPK